MCRPLSLGGLGIRDLQRADTVLRTRWLWLKYTDTSRPWSHLHIPHDPTVSAIFRASTTWTLGDERTCRCWGDHCINGDYITDNHVAALVIAMS